MPCFFILKAKKDILQHIELVNWWIRGFVFWWLNIIWNSESFFDLNRWCLKYLRFFSIFPVLHQFCQLYSEHDFSHYDSHHSQLLHCSSFTQKSRCSKTYKYQNRHSVSIRTITFHKNILQLKNELAHFQKCNADRQWWHKGRITQ